MLSYNGFMTILRNLAKSNRYQSLYANAKDHDIKLFKNNFDFTELQLSLLNYLGMYSSLSLDIYMKEVNPIVLDNFIFEDAYLYYKAKGETKDKQQNSQSNSRRQPAGRTQEIVGQSDWVFRTPSKKDK